MTGSAVEAAERTDSIALADGRQLAWSEWGPSAGIPVIFCTGAGMSGALGFGTDHLASLNIRLIAPDRPGLGGSDAHQAKTFDTWADDMSELIAQRSLQQPFAVGFSQGAPFALVLAARGKVRAASIVSGQDDLAHPAINALLPAEVRNMITAARGDPLAFEKHIAGSATVDWLWQMIMGMSAECDRALYQRHDFGSLYRRSLEEGFQSGAQGYARDLAIAVGPWPFAVEEIRTPVDLWYGRQDKSPVHSPDFGATLAKRIPGASLVVDDRFGGAILWERALDILRKLAAH